MPTVLITSRLVTWRRPLQHPLYRPLQVNGITVLSEIALRRNGPRQPVPEFKKLNRH